MPKSRTTLRDIAKVLNVSVTTVSRALNDREDISPAMKVRVVETARLLEYKPNSLARSLRNSTSSKLIGVIIPALDHYFYSTIMKGVTMGQEDEYCVIIGESNHDPDREVELIDQYVDHFVAGLVIVPSRDTRSFSNFQELKTRGLPFILLDRTFDGFEGSYITYDDYEGARIATKHLIEQGKTRIGLLQGSKDCSISKNRYRGYKDSLQEHNIKLDNALVKRCPEASKTEAFEACEKLWESSAAPNAIFTITDQLAAGVYNFAQEHSIAIPDDLAVVGYSNSEISDILYPSLTTVNQDGQYLGQMARQQIIKEIETNSPPLHKTLGTELIVRKSSQSV